MKKIELEYGSGWDTILFNILDKKFYSFEQMSSENKEQLGVEEYYTSRSGSSGAGFTKNDMLVPFGVVRVDAKGMQKYKIVNDNVSMWSELFGYITIASHSGIQGRGDNYPQLILSDGERVGFFSLNGKKDGSVAGIFDEKALEALTDWNKFWEKLEEMQSAHSDNDPLYKTINIPYFDNYLAKIDRPIKVYGSYMGWNVKRFIDNRLLRFKEDCWATADYLESDMNNIILNFGSPIDSENKIYWNKKWEKFIHLDQFHTIDFVGTRDECYRHAGYSACLDKESNEVYGITYDEELFLVKKKGFELFYTLEIKSGDSYMDYEHKVSIYESDLVKDFQEIQQKLVEKVQKNLDLIHPLRKCKEKAKWIEAFSNKDRNLSINAADSIATGNCKIGTERFIEKYNLQDTILVVDLLQHEKFKVMLQVDDFRKVLVYVLTRPEKDAIKEEE